MLLALRYTESCERTIFSVTFDQTITDWRWAGSFSNCSGQEMAFSEVVLQWPL